MGLGTWLDTWGADESPENTRAPKAIKQTCLVQYFFWGDEHPCFSMLFRVLMPKVDMRLKLYLQFV